MRTLRAFFAAVVVIVTAVLFAGATSASAMDFRLEHTPDGWQTVEQGDGVLVVLEDGEASERYQWRISTTDGTNRLVGEVEVLTSHFDVERERQVVPLVDEQLFSEVPSTQNVDQGVNPYRVLNITRHDDGSFTYRLSFPVNEQDGQAVLLLERDVTPPGHTVGEVQDITYNSFFVQTTTDEPAYAVLWIRPADAEPDAAVEHRTTTPSFTQNFPVVGLQPETEYVFHVEFMDWAGNKATSADVAIKTAPLIIGESPQILSVHPEPDSRFDVPPEAIEATFDPVEGEIGQGGVRLFVNLQEVSWDVALQPGIVRYVPAEPFEPGEHVVRIELTNTVNGEASMRWSFIVEESQTAPHPAVVIVPPVLLAGLVVARRLVGAQRP